jgi:hypothetical protein
MAKSLLDIGPKRLSGFEPRLHDTQKQERNISRIGHMLYLQSFSTLKGLSHDLTKYYTEDAVLDVNGLVSKGKAAIEKLYAGLGGGGEAPAFKGAMHMLLNNAIINVDGNSATAWFVWTGFINDDIKKSPRALEQGTEYDELIKVKGQWFINKRYITADSGLSGDWPTYKPRSFR